MQRCVDLAFHIVDKSKRGDKETIRCYLTIHLIEMVKSETVIRQIDKSNTPIQQGSTVQLDTLVSRIDAN